MTLPGLTQDVEHGLFMLHLSSMSNDKERAYTKKNGLLLPKIAKSDIVSLFHGLCGTGECINENIDWSVIAITIVADKVA
jgi:uncharacterized protein YkvS